MNTRKQIDWITGLKGIACIGVMLMHFRGAFMVNGASGYQISDGMHFMFDKILSVWLNGNFMVCLFCTISGYLLSKSNLVSVRQLCVKLGTRYLRLALPLLGGCILVFVLYSAGAFYNDTAGMLMENTWFSGFYHELEAKNIILSPFYKIVLHGEDSFGMPFWMMGSLLKGSFLSLAFVYVKKGRDCKAIQIIVLLGAIVCLLNALRVGSYILPAFFFGTMIGFAERDIVEKVPTVCGWIFLIIALVMCAGFQDGICSILDTPQWMYSSGMWRTVWSVFLFMGILCLVPVQNWLSKKVCVILGGISFEIYILHWPVICSLSAGLFAVCYGKVNTDILIVLLLGAALMVTIAASEIFKRYYEKYCMKLIKWIERKLGV